MNKEGIDLFDSLVRKGTFSINRHDDDVDSVDISLSYDMIPMFVEMANSGISFLPYVINFRIYDERKCYSVRDIEIIKNLIKTLRDKMNGEFKYLILELSDDMIGAYNDIIDSEFQDIKRRVVINMSIDRHPVINDGRKNMNMAKSLGVNTFSVKQLMMLDNNDLDYLMEKRFISERVYFETRNLKSIVEDFNKYLEETYYLDRLSDYQKVIIVYRWIRGKINTIYRPEDRVGEYCGTDIDDTYLTYISCRGSDLAKAKLLDILLSRSCLQVNSCLLPGKYKGVSSVGVGTVINGNLYYSNLSAGIPMYGVNDGHVFETEDINLKLYPMSFLSKIKTDGIDISLDDSYYRKKPHTRKR